MATNSRSYIMNRRGTGVADFNSVSTTSGELTIEQAEGAGIFTINCTHQVGIATATEVGLSPDRFPIRVKVHAAGGAFGAQVNETVCGYWRIVTAGNDAIPFSRKPLATDLAIKNLYANVPGLNDILWDAYRNLNAAALLINNFPEVDTINEKLYPILCLLAPTPEQLAEIPKLVIDIIAASNVAQRVPYFRVADNAYLRAVPHGKAYADTAGIPASRVAAYELALTIMVNYGRLKARYDAQTEGILTLSAFSIGAMFRHGLFESYEHREYYTVVVVPVANTPGQFRVDRIVSPVGIAAPAGIANGNILNLAGFKVKREMVELSNLMVMCSGLMHYLFNHTTGGTTVSGTLLTVLAMYKLINVNMPGQTQEELTSVLYESLHPSNKRAIANLFFNRSGVTTHGRCATAPRYEKFELDSFTQLRMNPYPAGSHKAFICIQALDRVLQAGLGPLLPWADHITDLIGTCRTVLHGGARAHIGSGYYTGNPPAAQPASLDEFLPELACYVRTFNKGDSLSLSPHMSDETSKRAGMNWQNLLKGLKSQDVSDAPIDIVRRFLATGGALHFTFDPNKEETWAKANEDANLARKSITNIFNV